MTYHSLWVWWYLGHLWPSTLLSLSLSIFWVARVLFPEKQRKSMLQSRLHWKAPWDKNLGASNFFGKWFQNRRWRQKGKKEEIATQGVFTAMGLNAARDPLKNHIKYASNCASEGWEAGYLSHPLVPTGRRLPSQSFLLCLDMGWISHCCFRESPEAEK